MLRRNLLHWIRYPSLAIMLVAQPIAFLLLFVYVFGGTLGAGLPGVPGGGDRGDYLEFITPGILVIAVASVALGTAIEVAYDMTGGIIARFRTMDIAKVSVLTGHVLGAVVKTLFAVAVTLAFAMLIGYRSDAGPVDWLIAFALLVLMAFALTWLTVGMGLAADSVETASNTPLFLVMLPFLSSAFVPTEAMPCGPAPVRGVPAVHSDDRQPPGTDQWCERRVGPVAGARLVRADRRGSATSGHAGSTPRSRRSRGTLDPCSPSVSSPHTPVSPCARCGTTTPRGCCRSRSVTPPATGGTTPRPWWT